MAKEVTLDVYMRVRREWLLRLAVQVARINRWAAARMAERTIVEYRAGSMPRWERIDIKRAVREQEAANR